MLLAAGPLLGLAETVDRGELAPPNAVAAGQGDWLWIVWLGPGGAKDHDSGLPTRIFSKATNNPWSPAQEKYLPRVQAAAARGNRLDVFLPQGRHFIYDPTGEGQPAEPLPRGLVPVSVCADGDRLFVLAARGERPATTGPATAPQTQDDGPAPTRSLHVLSQEFGAWTELPALPPALADAQAMTLVVHLLHPAVVTLLGGSIVQTELADQAPPAGPHWQTTVLQTSEDLPPLADLRAFSVNQQLYLVCWPARGDRPLIVAQVSGGKLIDPADMPQDSLPARPGAGAATHAERPGDFEVTAAAKQLVLVRPDPSGADLLVRRFNLQTRKFEGEWQSVGGGGARPDWLHDLSRNPAIGAAIMITLAILLLLRRPAGVIRLPVEVEPARLTHRLLAFLVDWLPCALAGEVVVWGLDADAYQEAVSAALKDKVVDPRLLASFGLALLFLVVYQSLAEGLTGTTLGKRIFKLSVFSVHGVRPVFGQIVARNVVKALELMFLPLLLVMLIHPARQRLGDMLAGTIVASPRRQPLAPWVKPPGPRPTDESGPDKPKDNDEDSGGPPASPS